MILNHFNSVAGHEDKFKRIMNRFGQTRLREDGKTFVVVTHGFEHLWLDPHEPYPQLAQRVKKRFPWMAVSISEVREMRIAYDRGSE